MMLFAFHQDLMPVACLSQILQVNLLRLGQGMDVAREALSM